VLPLSSEWLIGTWALCSIFPKDLRKDVCLTAIRYLTAGLEVERDGLRAERGCLQAEQARLETDLLQLKVSAARLRDRRSGWPPPD
jgi:hypothetical protein